MENTKPGGFSLWKLFGLAVALCALGYKIYYTNEYYDSISMWWGSLIFVVYAVYITNAISVLASLIPGELGAVLAVSSVMISLVFLGIDGFSWLGFVVSLDGTPMIERGFFPLSHFLNIIAGVFYLLGYFSIARRAKNATL